jgi:serine/threonine protein kinase
MFFEEYELEELYQHKVFAFVFNQAYKYMNIARLLNLRWIVQLQEVIRTPKSLILVTPAYETTLEKLFIDDCSSLTTARAIYMLANAVICLYNYGIAHRGIRPSTVLVQVQPKLKVKLCGFDRSTSYWDNDTFPNVKPSDYNPPDINWVSGSKNWDLYSLSMIIFEWHLRRMGVIKNNGKEVPLLKVKMKKKEMKSYPTVVQLAFWNIIHCHKEMVGAQYLREEMEKLL